MQIPAKNPVVVGDGAKRFEGALTLLVKLVGIANLSQSAHRYLSRKRELLSHLKVAQLLERKLAESLVIPGHLGDVVGCCISSLKGSL